MLLGRRQIFSKLNAIFKQNKSPVAWFHCASLGEFEQGRPVIESYKINYPTHKILLTFYSPSGYEVRKNYAGADLVCYLPFDTLHNAKKFLTVVNPTIAFFVKYEFWYHYLRLLHHQFVPTLSISAIFREDQIFFQKYRGKFFREILGYFSHIFVQNKTSKDLLKSIGLGAKVTRSGDTRFDRVRAIAVTQKVIPLAKEFKNDQKLLIVGSAWAADFEALLPFLNTFEAPLKVIFAPHEVHPEEITSMQTRLTKPSIKYSEAKAENIAAYDILWIDSVGMLASLYQYADFAWIGGGYGKGLHNTLEAATFGLPLFFGNKNYRKFQEANDLIAAGSAYPIENTTQFEMLFKDLYHNPYKWHTKSQVSLQYVEQNIGATQQIMDWVLEKN